MRRGGCRGRGEGGRGGVEMGYRLGENDASRGVGKHLGGTFWTGEGGGNTLVALFERWGMWTVYRLHEKGALWRAGHHLGGIFLAGEGRWGGGGGV